MEATTRQTLLLPRLIPYLLVMLLLASLTACGLNNATDPPVVGINCGLIHTFGFDGLARFDGPFSGPDAIAQGETCFLHAHQRCQTATLKFLLGGVDSSSTHTFIVQRNGQNCRISDANYFYSANGGGSSSLDSYTCKDVVAQAGGLLFSGCGADGDVIIPRAVVAAPAPGFACLLTGAGQNDASAAACLLSKYTTCETASLIYQHQDSVQQTTTHTITIQPVNNQCAISDAVQVVTRSPEGNGSLTNIQPYVLYPCAALVSTPTGLLVKGCGAAGDVLIPGGVITPTPGGAG